MLVLHTKTNLHIEFPKYIRERNVSSGTYLAWTFCNGYTDVMSTNVLR